MLGAVEGDQNPIIQAPEGVKHAPGRDGGVKQRVERRGGGAVQRLADMRIGGDFANAEQGLAVRPPVALAQPTLMVEEGGAAHEEQRESGQADIGHAVGALARPRLAPVGQAGADGAQCRNQGFEDAHQGIESGIAPRRQGEAHTQGGKPGVVTNPTQSA